MDFGGDIHSSGMENCERAMAATNGERSKCRAEHFKPMGYHRARMDRLVQKYEMMKRLRGELHELHELQHSARMPEKLREDRPRSNSQMSPGAKDLP